MPPSHFRPDAMDIRTLGRLRRCHHAREIQANDRISRLRSFEDFYCNILLQIDRIAIMRYSFEDILFDSLRLESCH